MEKITRKSFVAAICNNHTNFIGCPRCDAEKCDAQLGRIAHEMIKSDYMMEERTAIEKSNQLVFCNGSHLYMNVGDRYYHAEKFGEHFYMLESLKEDGTVWNTCVYHIVGGK